MPLAVQYAWIWAASLAGDLGVHAIDCFKQLTPEDTKKNNKRGKTVFFKAFLLMNNNDDNMTTLSALPLQGYKKIVLFLPCQ